MQQQLHGFDRVNKKLSLGRFETALFPSCFFDVVVPHKQETDSIASFTIILAALFSP
jgi:hypothetical protein